ncbi:MAG: 7-carboxy-7-deazaguanine synthase QueE [Elusimicrobiota bacterium]
MPEITGASLSARTQVRGRSAAELLVKAFPEHRLDAAGAFGLSGRTYLDRDAFIRAARGRSWRRLGRRFLEEHREAVLFLSPKGLAAYLPAFLDAVLRHHRRLDMLPSFLCSALTRHKDGSSQACRFASLLRYLGPAQKRAVAAVLAEAEGQAKKTGLDSPATAALDSYWRGQRGDSGENAGQAEGRTAPRARIVEVFSSLQGEGLRLGQRQIFVRFGGCNLRCRYCDEPAGRPGTGSLWTADQLKTAIKALCRNQEHAAVSWTGGEPLLHADFLKPLMVWVRQKGMQNHLETNGTLPEALKSLARLADLVSMDIKLPSGSGQRLWDEHEAFLRVLPRKTFIKVVLTAASTRQEFDRLLVLMAGFPRVPLFLQPATAHPGRRKAASRPLSSAESVRWIKRARGKLGPRVLLSPQWHPLWGLK